MLKTQEEIRMMHLSIEEAGKHTKKGDHEAYHI